MKIVYIIPVLNNRNTIISFLFRSEFVQTAPESKTSDLNTCLNNNYIFARISGIQGSGVQIRNRTAHIRQYSLAFG